eukprot:m.260431 g.260431  ORF g.260431 m.260431 type:complete len:411 (+) comp39913_c0_seq1:171-1403(+)
MDFDEEYVMASVSHTHIELGSIIDTNAWQNGKENPPSPLSLDMSDTLFMEDTEFDSATYDESLEETFDLDRQGFEDFLFSVNKSGESNPCLENFSTTANRTTSNAFIKSTKRSDPDLSGDSGMDGDTTDCSTLEDGGRGSSGGSSPLEQHPARYFSRSDRHHEGALKSRIKPKVLPNHTAKITACGSNAQPTAAQKGLRKGPRNVETLVASITEREKKVLNQIPGYKLKTNCGSLTKHDERELRRELRKIRNKDSAVKSRRKKEERIKGLEEEMARCTAINVELENKVTTLEVENKSLLQQLDELRLKLYRQAADNNMAALVVMVVACCAIRIDHVGSQLQDHDKRSTEYRSRTLKSSFEAPTSPTYNLINGFVAQTAVQFCMVALLLGVLLFAFSRKHKPLTTTRFVDS